MIITDKFYRTHDREFFEDKTATTLRDLKNRGGDEIKKGTTVIIEGKRKGFMISLLSQKGIDIRKLPNMSRVCISGVNIKDLDINI